MFESWESLHKRNEVTENERQTLISNLAFFYERKFKNVKGSGPTKAIFQKVLQKSRCRLGSMEQPRTAKSFCGTGSGRDDLELHARLDRVAEDT